ncbi:MAG: hypothetical protein IJG18_12445 [Kiritimatiellae bacterium]|nr:hypothetical protein [Kiritimatiellia bacterium]
MTMNPCKRRTDSQDSNSISILGISIVMLHKVLKEEDRLRAMHKQNRYGEPMNTEPCIAIDFSTITSIQEDYKNNGTVIIDKKTAVMVKEPFEDVLDVWIEVQNRMQSAKAI